MTHDELIKERERQGLTQEEMSKKLGLKSVHTYRKWEQNQRKVPVWVEKELIPKQLDMGPLTLEEMNDIAELAAAEGISYKAMTIRIVKDGIARAKKAAKRSAPIVAFSFFCWMAFAPGSGTNEAGMFAAIKTIAGGLMEILGL